MPKRASATRTTSSTGAPDRGGSGCLNPIIIRSRGRALGPDDYPNQRLDIRLLAAEVLIDERVLIPG
jgi:hypothetical protein